MGSMKRAATLLAIGVFFVLPLISFAWYPGQPLLPNEVINGAPYNIQACHVVQVVDNLLDFGVYISALIVTIMFVYAGFLYVTASARPDNLNQAKNVFGMVALGFVIVLTAWLMVNIILHVLTNQDIEFWTDIECVAYSSSGRAPTGPSISDAVQTPVDQRREQETRALLRACNVGVNNINACPTGQTTGCTTTDGIQTRTIGYACNTGKAVCAGQTDSCEIVLSGGSEGGHSGGTNPGSHGSGDKIDFRRTSNLDTWVRDQETSGRFTKVDSPTFGTEQWVDTQTGAVWTNEGDHFDVCVSNCSAPAARGS